MATRPPTRVRPWPNRASRPGTASWVSTVLPSSTNVTNPAPAADAPPWTAHVGAVDNSAAYPLKPVNETTSSGRRPGSRVRLSSGGQAQRSDAGTKSRVRSPV